MNSEIEQKKIMLLNKKEKLLAELSNIDKDIEYVMEEAWKEEANLIYEHVDALLAFCKIHTGLGCSDTNIKTDNCLRCKLLDVQEANNPDVWDHLLFGISVELVDRENNTKRFVKEPTVLKQKKVDKLEPPAQKLSKAQSKAKAAGMLRPDGTARRILEINEDEADLD